MMLGIRTVRSSDRVCTSRTGAAIEICLRTQAWGFSIVSLFLVCLMLPGCGDHLQRGSPEELRTFEMVTPDGPSVDMNRLVRARIPTGPYRLVPGDVLQIEMPVTASLSSPSSTAAEGKQTYNCRIGESGTIVLPVVGELPAAGRSLSEVESCIVAAYSQDYVKGPFPVYVSVHEYKTRRVSIVGAVAKPGIYALRQDQMSLVALLMEAGGIAEKGAAVIRITQSGAADPMPDADRITVASNLVGGDRQTRVAARAVFEREGPLNTTGWLGLEEGGTVLLRRWVDIGNDPQRQLFLQAATAKTRQPVSDDLQTRLSGLAACLQSNPQRQDVPSGIQDAGWEAADRQRFVARLRAPVQARRLAGVTTSNEGPAREEAATVVALPVRGLNIPFADVVLGEGDAVAVEQPREQFVSVIGLVSKPGNFPYPADAQYNLIQAVAFAGGLDMVADPRYVSLYRLKVDGTIASTTIRLVNPKNKEQLTEALALPLKPGDVVSVEHTPRTRTNVFFDRIFRVSLGLYFSPERLWE